ncbi:MAG: restriction endonuclease subunit S [Stigonema ocellatum SAG 48.90 = DSM 106950]|nr:restriction endonuclease subunit S [Stigonema ocellatum SAG 48.90 = DSM 106950]
MIAETKTPKLKVLYKLPKEWQWVPLGTATVAEVIMGQSPPSTSYNFLGKGLPFFQGKAEFGDLYPVPRKWCTKAIKIAKPGDVLISVRAPVGSTNLVKDECCIGRGLAAIRPTDNILTKYLFYALRVFESKISSLGRGSTFASIGKIEISAFSLPIPYSDNPICSLDIQCRIVARIETLLAEVKESRSLINKMRQDAERLLAVAIDEVFLKLESVTDIVPFSEVATAFNGKAVGEGDSSIRVFKSKHVYPHSLRLDRPSFMKVEQVQKMPKNRFLKPSDVLMANAAEGTLGRVTYVDKCAENWTVDGKIMILRSLDEQNLLVNKWLYYYLWSERGRREILFRRTGTAFAENRGQTGISPRSVLEIPVPKPPINQQHQAVAYLDKIQYEVDEILKLLEQDANVLDMLEQSILERAFRGEL